jgi:hypothetical protein
VSATLCFGAGFTAVGLAAFTRRVPGCELVVGLCKLNSVDPLLESALLK